MSAPYDTPLKECGWCGDIYNTDENKACPYCEKTCAECGDYVSKIARDEKSEQQLCESCQRIIGA